MKHHFELLATALAYLDEIHAPIRLWQTNQPANLLQRRKLFAEQGQPLAPASADEAEKKERQRIIGSLVEQAHVLAIKGSGRTTGIKLTPRGELTARALCATYNSNASVAVLLRVMLANCDGYGVDAERSGERVWVPECALTPDPDRPGFCARYGLSIKPMIGTALQAAHALANDWLQTTSDSNGRVFYRATNIGQRIADNPPAEPSDLPRMDKTLAAIYDAEALRLYQFFQQATPPNATELAVPAVEGCYPVHYKTKVRFK